MVNFGSLSFYEKLSYIFSNLTFAVSLIGITGNLLAVLIFSRRCLRKYSYSVYNQSKALLDTLVLLNCTFVSANYIFGFNLNDQHEFFCFFGFYARYVALIASMCLVTVTSFDRYVVVALNNRYTCLNKRWFQAFVVVCVLVYACLVEILILLEPVYRTVHVNNSTSVRASCRMSNDVANKVSWIYVGNIIVLILLVNNFVNIKLIVYIASSRRRVASSISMMFGGDRIMSRTAIRDRKFALASIGISCTAFVCKLPIGITIIVLTTTRVDFGLSLFLLNFNLMLLAVESGSTFFVNMLVNTVFHDETLVAVGLKQRQTSPTNS